MTESEVTAAKARLQRGAAPAVAARRGISLTWTVWVVILACIFLLEFAHRSMRGGGRPDMMEYRGQQFKMSKAYATYEDYKDDPNNLDTNELDRIEQVMTTAKVPDTFKDRKAFIELMFFELEFPGYGASAMGGVTDDGSQLDVESVEIPQREKDRVIVARETRGQVSLIDDFVFDTATNQIERVELKNQTLRYYDTHNHIVRERRLNP